MTYVSVSDDVVKILKLTSQDRRGSFCTFRANVFDRLLVVCIKCRSQPPRCDVSNFLSSFLLFSPECVRFQYVWTFPFNSVVELYFQTLSVEKKNQFSSILSEMAQSLQTCRQKIRYQIKFARLFSVHCLKGVFHSTYWKASVFVIYFRIENFHVKLKTYVHKTVEDRTGNKLCRKESFVFVENQDSLR